MVACYRNATTCEWHHYNETKLAELSRSNSSAHKSPAPLRGPHELTFDFWVVNGNPNLSLYNTLLFQFSFDRQNTVELYLLFWVCYIILVPLQIYAVRYEMIYFAFLHLLAHIKVGLPNLCYSTHLDKFSLYAWLSTFGK